MCSVKAASKMKTSLRVHRVNFFEPKPQAVRCISYDKSTCHLAVSRADSSIEIWDVKENPFLQKIIPGTPDASVEALAWCKGRLLSAGLQGRITEHDLTTLLPKYQLYVTSSCPIWCMSLNTEQDFLAIGNEDGHVILYEMSDEGLDYEKKFDRQEGCILCLDWHKDGKLIVTGSIDAIRVWNVETGHVINRIILSRVNKNTPTVVWCISITRDMTIISGDSCGKTSFWDGNTGTLLSATTTGAQKEDILTLFVSEDEDVVYTSGVDPTITMYMKSQSNGKWLKSIQRVVHSHDVRAIQLVGEFLVSGGDDCNLVFTKYPPKTTVKFFPFCQKSYAVTTLDPPFILLRYPGFVEVWKIGDNTTRNHLVRVRTRENEKVICSTISSNGEWLAYSSQYHLRLFSLRTSAHSQMTSLDKVALPKEIHFSSSILIFTSDSTKLLLYAKNSIYIIKCDIMQPRIKDIINEDLDCAGQVSLMELSPNDNYLACGCHNGNIVIYELRTLKVFCKLPLYKCQVTALKFDSSSENLIAVYSNRKVIEYSLKQLAYTAWCKQQMLLNFQEASIYPITSVCFCSNQLYLQDENTLYIFNRGEQAQSVKKKVKQSEESSVDVSESKYTTIKQYEHISSIHSFLDDLVLVQISSSQIMDCLPPPVWKKKYGT